MKRVLFAALAVLGLFLAAPRASEAQVSVSINIGHPRPYVHRVYAPPVYHGRPAYYRCGYHGCGRELVVVRPHRPRPVVVVRDRYHRGYRHR